MHFLSLIEIKLLKVMRIDFYKYEFRNGAKKRERFLVSKREFIL